MNSQTISNSGGAASAAVLRRHRVSPPQEPGYAIFELSARLRRVALRNAPAGAVVGLRNSDGLSAGLLPGCPLAWRLRALKRCGASAVQWLRVSKLPLVASGFAPALPSLVVS